jgi:hypothetical protein
MDLQGEDLRLCHSPKSCSSEAMMPIQYACHRLDRVARLVACPPPSRQPVAHAPTLLLVLRVVLESSSPRKLT